MINCAGKTNIEECEIDEDDAFQTVSRSPERLPRRVPWRVCSYRYRPIIFLTDLISM